MLSLKLTTLRLVGDCADSAETCLAHIEESLPRMLQATRFHLLTTVTSKNKWLTTDPTKRRWKTTGTTRITQTIGKGTKTTLAQNDTNASQEHGDKMVELSNNGSQATTTKKKTNVLGGFLAVLAFALVLYWERRVMGPWISQKMQQLDIIGCLALLSAALTVLVWCKDQCIDFYYTQQRRLTYVDETPGIKKDVADIKAILSRPWYKR